MKADRFNRMKQCVVECFALSCDANQKTRELIAQDVERMSAAEVSQQYADDRENAIVFPEFNRVFAKYGF